MPGPTIKTFSGCFIHRIFSISLLCGYRDLCNSETNEVYVFILSIYSVSNYCASSFTFYHLVKTREICKYSVPICALVIRRFGGVLQRYSKNFVVVLKAVVVLQVTQISINAPRQWSSKSGDFRILAWVEVQVATFKLARDPSLPFQRLHVRLNGKYCIFFVEHRPLQRQQLRSATKWNSFK
jgi:hypothetical protein